VSAASQEDSEKLGTYFCGNPRVEKQKYSKVAFIIIMPGEELFVEASILEAKDFFDKICIIEGKHTFFNKPKTEFVMDSSN
jgi:hypothetical protein